MKDRIRTMRTQNGRTKRHCCHLNRRVFKVEALEERALLAMVAGTDFSENGMLPTASTSLVVEFSEEVVGAGVLENYEIRHAGQDGLLGNADDPIVPITSSDFDGTIATLGFPAVVEDVFRLTVRDSITDALGNPIDGDADGTVGGDFQSDFVVGSTGDQPPMAFFPDEYFPGPYAEFGAALASDGDFLVVGAPHARVSPDTSVFGEPGAAYLLNATTGELVTALRNPDSTTRTGFGTSVAISGNTVAVGNGGSRVYVFDATSGSLVQTIDDPVLGGRTAFGHSVAVSGDLILVGSPGVSATVAGSAHVFEKSTGALVATLVNPAPSEIDSFGTSVSLSGDLAIVGAPVGQFGDGGVYTYDANTGALITTLENPGSLFGAFGDSVAISQGLLVVGASQNNVSGSYVGSVYIFDLATGELLHTLNNPRPGELFRFGSALAVSNGTLVVGSYDNGSIGEDGGIAYVYDTASGELINTLSNPTPAADDTFGYATAIVGDRIIVGAPKDDTDGNNTGSVYAFDPSTAGLITRFIDPTPPYSVYLGESVAVSGTVAVFGAPGDGTGGTRHGRAYVVETTTGEMIARLDNPTPNNSDEFGDSVAILGDKVLVAATDDGSGLNDGGSVYVFDNTSGSLEATISNPTPDFLDDFGSSIAVSNDRIVVAAIGDDVSATNSGVVYLFDASTLALVATLNNPSPDDEDRFGSSVAIFDDRVVVGAYEDDTDSLNAGRAYVFDATSGALLRTLSNPTPSRDDHFSGSVAIEGNTIAVGAHLDDAEVVDSGAVHVFDALTGSLIRTLVNPTPENGDCFGSKVAIMNDMIVVSAVSDDTGFDNSGSVYVFDAKTGALLQTIANPTPATNDFFGHDLAVSGESIVVGAVWDHTVNFRFGAAYEFKLDSAYGLNSPSGFEFRIDLSNHGAGQLVHGTGNAFDGLNRLRVDGANYIQPAHRRGTTADHDRTTVTWPAKMSELDVHREITVPVAGTADFARSIEVFHNPTEAPISFSASVVGNLGSDASTTVFATSDGDLDVEPTDTWFGTDDDDPSGGTFAIVHLIQGPYGQSPTDVTIQDDNVGWTYDLTVDAGETVRLAGFTVIGDTRENALDSAMTLLDESGLGGEGGSFLTQDELDSIANFNFAAPPAVESVIVNNGQAQRSSVTELTITFDSLVDAPDAAFQLTSLGTAANPTSHSVSDTSISSVDVGTRTIVTVRLSSFESLDDGNYRLDISADLVKARGNGRAMESDYVYGDQASDNFFRLYGDVNGDGVVNYIDFTSHFLPVFGSNTADDPDSFPGYLDYDGDGAINYSDFVNGFLPNFGKRR